MASSTEKKVFKQHRHYFMVAGTKFVVDTHYTPLKQVGTGAYGVVCAALDTRTNKKVAIKKVTNAFQDLVDAKRILREMKLLRHFKHENIIGMSDLINTNSKDDFEDVYLVFEFMETDMHKIIYSKNELTDEHTQYFAYQMLRGLKHIHGANVLHRDLKPSNLLLNGNCDLKICDFGLARGIGVDHSVELTEYVVTRWYRAPEIMCACQEYDSKIDVWSVGCILMELLLRKPLFPGDDYIHQLNLIFQLLGTPNSDDLDWVSNEKALQYVLSLPKQAPVPFEKLFSKKPTKPNPLALDLISKMLTFNPNKRCTVEEAIAHPYLKSLNVKEPIPPPPAFDFQFETRAGTKAGIQECMLEEIAEFRPDWVRSQFHPEEYVIELDEVKPCENVPPALAGTSDKK